MSHYYYAKDSTRKQYLLISIVVQPCLMLVVLSPQYDIFGIIFYNEDEHFWKVAHNADLEFIDVQPHNSM